MADLGRLAAPSDGLLTSEIGLSPLPQGLPERIGAYRIIECIGVGGMGMVYKAEQRTPVKRLVAIKLIKPGFDSKEVIGRFESERQALARMNHACVAKVLDAGADDMGRPYFVMEYVPGVALTDFADQNKLPIKQRLELFTDVCAAVAHAHSKGIIHRDIKSGNVLAYFADGKPVVKVIDFGIAKALSGDRLTDLTMNTRFGQPLGTYVSMSPEQADGSPDIDTRTDVYSLGVLLYELLTGAAPFDREVFAKAADDEIRRIIRDVEPPRPSTRLTSLGDAGTKVASDRQEPLNELANELRTELEWIPLMAMRKSRDRRYATPLELADDIRRYLEHRPLRAGPESFWYIARKTLRRHRLGVAAALAVFVSLAAGLIVSVYLTSWAMREEAVATHAVEAIENAMAFGGDYEMARHDLISARRLHTNALDELRLHNQASAAVLAGLNEIDSSEDGQIPLLGSFGDEGGVIAFRGHLKKPNNVAVLRGFRALTAGTDGQLYLWDLLTGRAIQHKASEGDVSLSYVAVSADRVFAATAGSGGKVRLWDVDTLNEQPPLQKSNTKELWMVAISADGRRILAGTNDGELWLWEKQDHWSPGRRLREASAGTESIAAIAFPPHESRYVLIGDGSGQLSLWDLQTATRLWEIRADKHKDGPNPNINCIAFSNDGAMLATASFNGTVVLWNVQGSGAGLRLVRNRALVETDPPARQWRVAFSPDGAKVATAGDGGVVRVCDLSGRRLHEFVAQTSPVTGVAFVDDNTLVSTGDDTLGSDRASLVSALRLWDLSDRGVVLPQAAGAAKRLTVDDAGNVKIEMTSGQTIDACLGPDGRIRVGTAGADCVLPNLSSDYAAALAQATWLKGASRSVLSHGNPPVSGVDAWQELNAGDSTVKFFTNSLNELELRGPAEDAARSGSDFVHLRTLRGQTARVLAAGISPNGRFIASIDEHGRCLGWDLLRPALCRDLEVTLLSWEQNHSATQQQTRLLVRWFTVRGREDLAQAVAARTPDLR